MLFFYMVCTYHKSTMMERDAPMSNAQQRHDIGDVV